MNIVDPKLSFKGIQKANNTHENIVIHHALKKNCTVQDVHRWHIDKGYVGIGYHFFVAKNGTVYQGRNINWQGGHCSQQSMNIKSIGICLEGCYEDYLTETEKTVPDAQLKALTELVLFLMDKYKIPAGRIYPHRHFATYKKCPGNYFPWEVFIKNLTKPVTGGEYKMKPEDAQKIVDLLGSVYELIPTKDSSVEARTEINRLANEVRKSGGLPIK